ncbi:MAG: radical SAM family heme chaperone HemW [Anaerovoracaceae bacterium]
MRNSLGLYIHIPFCQSKCKYCGFLSKANESEEQIDKYVKYLISEIEINSESVGLDYYVDSIFIGGGTPSILKPGQIKGIMEAIKSNFYVSKNAEITIESNPNSLDEIKLKTYLKSGINRISIGVQSLDNLVLKTIGRVHNRDEAIKAIKLVKNSGFENINVDLMFGLPNQSIETWLATLNEIIKLEPKHISFYTLQLEENTPFYKDYKEGAIDLPPNSLNNEMYHSAIKILKDKGFDHYEISNSAKDGYSCMHNLKYWYMAEYMGIGLGASSFMKGYRAKNVTDIEEYYASIEEEYSSLDPCEFHEETLEEAYGIYVFTGLRTRAGINLELFKENFGKSFEDVFSEKLDYIKKLVGEGYVIYNSQVLALTEKGIDISNDIMCEFV